MMNLKRNIDWDIYESGNKIGRETTKGKGETRKKVGHLTGDCHVKYGRKSGAKNGEKTATEIFPTRQLSIKWHVNFTVNVKTAHTFRK